MLGILERNRATEAVGDEERLLDTLHFTFLNPRQGICNQMKQ